MDNLARKIQRQERLTTQTQQQQRVATQGQRRPRITLGEKVLFTGFVMALLVAGIILINNYASIYTLDHNIQSMEKDMEMTAKEIEELELKVSELRAPERIMDIAKNELGMSLNEKNIKVINP